jgi:hypothetical protein
MTPLINVQIPADKNPDADLLFGIQMMANVHKSSHHLQNVLKV